MSDANVDVVSSRARAADRLRAVQPVHYTASAYQQAMFQRSHFGPVRLDVMSRKAVDHGLPVDIDAPGAGPSYGYRNFGKRALDLLLVALAAPIALTLIGVAAALLWAEGGAPFYRQQRLGRGGNTFWILKLRTMVPHADRLLEAHLAADPALREEWATTQKLKRDPRITEVGALLRKTSMDELPQLWNVLKGEMSLVGPRPMLPEQLPIYGDAVHYFALRPGITGYWQVAQRNDGVFRARVAMDAAYDFDVSMLEDAKILWRTVGAVVKRTGY